MIETRQPDPAETPVAIGACRAVTITAVSETGWWDTPRMMADIKAGGGAAACQWRMRFDPDNAAGSCSLIEVEGLDGVTRRILLDAGWNADYMAERFRATGVDRLLAEGGIDFLLLSHEHLDHFWGIEAVLRLAPAIPILVPGTLREEGLAWLRGGSFPEAGIANRVPHRGPLVRMLPGGVHRLMPGLASVTFDLPILLDIRGEQSLYANVAGEGMVCITGCCHQGVLNLVDYAKDHLECGGQVYGLYGGLHLAPFAGMSEEQAQTVRALGRYGFRRIAANHCTGAEAIALMRRLGYPVVGGSGRDGSDGTAHLGNGDSVRF
ncbi:MAG TPA: MBL fold metallo-hydrolase [Candidatus Desulfobacillus sp.]|nr:MBL fold metallo-hydrolase [Candidatus Desulfobacillus sp.]